MFRGYELNEEQKQAVLEKANTELVGYDEEIIENQRCQRDPLYHLLFFPDTIYTLGNSANKWTYINRVLFSVFDVCERRVGTALKERPLIRRVFTRMLEPDIKDHKLKIVMLFLLMHIEPTVVDFFRSLYEPKSLELLHFNNIVPYVVSQAAYCIQNTAFNIYNIKKLKENFYGTLMVAYMSGGYAPYN